MPGTIIMGGFSIGNLQDIPLRVLNSIETVDIVAVEWKNAFENYFTILNKKPKFLMQYNPFDSTFEEDAKFLVNSAIQGKDILYLVDGGMPHISDPGNQLNILAKQNNINISVIPGPSIVTAALAVSNVFTHRFIFEPEVPEFKEERLNIFRLYKNIPSSIVFIANRNSEPSRFLDRNINTNFLVETLNDMLEIFGDRQISLCFNITMIDEEVIDGSISECIKWATNNKNNKFLTIVVDKNNQI